jgi:hypothetical protein
MLTARTAAAALLLVATNLALPAAPAAASDCAGGGADSGAGSVGGWPWTDCPSSGGGGNGGVGQVDADNPSAPGRISCRWRGEAVACSGHGGQWSNTRGCWVSLADPQPPADDPVWEGHTDGAVYRCVPAAADVNAVDRSWLFWAGSAPLVGDPMVAVHEAYQEVRRQVAAPRLGWTPLGEDLTLVGTDTWLWVANPGDAYGTVSATASVPGITVTVTARARQVRWDMGDGQQVVCATPGTPWQVGMSGDDPSPDCGHRYTRESGAAPGGRFRVRATVTWDVSWTGTGGLGGDIDPLQMAATRPLRVVELQVRQVA